VTCIVQRDASYSRGLRSLIPLARKRVRVESQSKFVHDKIAGVPILLSGLESLLGLATLGTQQHLVENVSERKGALSTLRLRR